jgi:hypothetical protein
MYVSEFRNHNSTEKRIYLGLNINIGDIRIAIPSFNYGCCDASFVVVVFRWIVGFLAVVASEIRTEFSHIYASRAVKKVPKHTYWFFFNFPEHKCLETEAPTLRVDLAYGVNFSRLNVE